MKLGIIGLPQAGKTTIFNALTRGNRPTLTSGGRFEVNTAVVDVPDPRVDRLSALFRPRKTIYAKVTYADIAGLEGSSSALSGPLLTELSQMDGFLHVARAFESEVVPHFAGSVDPVRDLASLEGELLLNDMLVVERKLERLAEEQKKGAGRDKAMIAREKALFERVQAALAEETPLRALDYSAEDLKALSGFALLTLKPVLVVANLSDGQPDLALDWPHAAVVSLQGKLEMEIAQLSEEEAAMFLEEYGIAEPSLSRMIRLSYDLLGLQSFFTVGEDEVRAWTVRRGATAPEAAGVIHSDLQKGFIRADVIGCEELLALGGLAEARAVGKLRLEGKPYIVADGEVVHIRFNL